MKLSVQVTFCAFQGHGRGEFDVLDGLQLKFDRGC